ncbi:helix-turn-helix domain-containing protein [Mesonia maritima]|uniref:Transcriptional regulator with XRE-family HTH domain n=1 Tax=Mesonia maritima TaxID=1793873 RepID=A0ABU1K999_9FLAO|nr:helix-turn-helix transcriptional regulator [Mesonia maritima]MDR6302182.1 transcriptional regulator with XRE-family HTH domain [Mesonia maritima]
MNSTATPHIGRKISRIRELRGMKQEALALELGVSQQTVSHMEQSETLEDDKLNQVAKVLGVSKEAIENFSEEMAINFFNSFQDSSKGTFNNHCTFNPLDKLMESHEENKKLYERLLESEKEKNTYLEKLLDRK